MRITPKVLVAATAALALGAGAAQAAPPQFRTMEIDLPDGSVAQLHYTGDVAPRVVVEPVEAVAPLRPMAWHVPAAFAEMQRISAMMDMRMAALLRQAEAMQRQALEQGVPAAPGVIMTGNLPQGVHFSYVSTTVDANGCTRTVSYASDGSGAAAELTEASSSGCDAMPREAPVVQASSQGAQAGQTAPVTRT